MAATGGERRRVPLLHVVTDDAVLAAPDVAERAQRVLAAGADRVALHLRGPRTSGRRLFDLAAALTPEARRHGGWLLVNDRVDVALAAGAHGVHLGQRSLPVPEARALVGPNRPVGASVHTAPELATADGDGADFVFVGTVHPSASHPGGAALGLDGFRALVAGRPGGTSPPALAIGGVLPEHVGALVAAGAAGVAVLGGVWGAPDPEAALGAYLGALDGAPEPVSDHPVEAR